MPFSIWGMLEVNPAKQGVENPQRRRTEKRPFESWDELESFADRLGPRSNRRPPYHAARSATGGNQWQRIWLDFARFGL
jgi:hypothetical protein